ncbi:DUF58 domain-containing protein [Sphingopyxis indica]|uniref:Uncharacterized conserved protein, DUF58 family, contains vWF domain n=1 Tax=Sphingopyxis indica TaxID=436663 RepID=A0A239JLV2_9SPHN|nr:DUF58 domain-containing protein [Sphingopyxis indica]SNT06881.1 Uncharacterized conserved protein, DUF58 family, contains vWF domain [Sphingopyxis indica]
MIYPTRRAIFLLLAGAPAALALGLVRPELWLVAPAWIGVIAACLILDILFGASPRRLALDARFPYQVGVGDPFELTLAARSSGTVPGGGAELALQVDERLAEGGRIAGRMRAADAGDAHPHTLVQTLPLAAARRGEARLEALWVRWRGPLGLVWKQRRFGVGGAISVVPSLRAATEEGRRLFQRNSLFGLRQQRLRGEGSEYEALAEYHPGMDRRAIDWTASARHVKLLAKEYRVERDNRVVLAIDAGRTMAEPAGGMPRVDRAVSAALLLAFVGLKLHDRISLFSFAAQPHALTPAYMHTQDFPALQRAAARIDYAHVESNFTLALAALGARLDRRSLIILFTEFTDATSADLMIRAAGRLVKKHRLLFVVIEDEELESEERRRPHAPADVTRANVAAAMLRERRLVIARLQRLGVDVIEVPADAMGASAVEAYLGIKRAGNL